MHQGEEAEGEVGEEAGQRHPTGCQSPWAGDEPGRKKGGVGPLEGEPGEAPLGQFGGAPGPAG